MAELAEVEALNIAQPSVYDNEWIMPVQEITGLVLTKRPHLESSSSALSNLDSPLRWVFLGEFDAFSAIQNKIFRFFGGESSADSTPAVILEKCESPKVLPLSLKDAYVDSPSPRIETPTRDSPFLVNSKPMTPTTSSMPDIAVFGSTPARISTISGRRMRLAVNDGRDPYMYF